MCVDASTSFTRSLTKLPKPIRMQPMHQRALIDDYSKREDGPLVMIGELVRYRPSAFRRGHRGRPLGLALGSVVLNGGHFFTGPA